MIINNICLVLLSFTASLGFGIAFHTPQKFLIYAGLGGSIVRIAAIFFSNVTDYRFVYVAFAAFIGSLYSEIIAKKYNTTSTLLLYTSIIPLIPGDLLYNAMVGIMMSNSEMVINYSIEFIVALSGVSVGLIVCSTFIHLVQKNCFKKYVNFIKEEKRYE